MSDQPNVLFVFSDQHRWCDLGCYGNKVVQTPHLDRFAAEGRLVTDCLANSPLCVPSRGSLLTGRYPLGHRAVANDLAVDTSLPSVATVLREAGYRTGYFGKWHLAGVPRKQAIAAEARLGFEAWKVCNCDHHYLRSHYHDEAGMEHPIEGYDAATYTDLALDFMQKSEDARPWAAWLAWGPPHDPYFEVPESYLQRYRLEDIQLRGNVPPLITHRTDQPEQWDHDTARQNLLGYYAHLTALDEQFGRLRAALEARGEWENTIVVYTSDHGDQLGSQGLTNKQLPYEESVRVPLILGGDRQIKPGRSEGMLGLVDLPVSLLGLLGLEIPGAEGEDLSGFLSGETTEGRAGTYLFDLVPCHQAFSRDGHDWRAVRTKRHTYAVYADGTPWLLFDHEIDPLQVHNLVNREEVRPTQTKLHRQVMAFAERYDALLTWPELLAREGLVSAWNESQRFFSLPELEL